MKSEIEKLENDIFTADNTKQKLQNELREYKQQCEKFEKMQHDFEVWKGCEFMHLVASCRQGKNAGGDDKGASNEVGNSGQSNTEKNEGI